MADLIILAWSYGVLEIVCHVQVELPETALASEPSASHSYEGSLQHRGCIPVTACTSRSSRLNAPLSEPFCRIPAPAQSSMIQCKKFGAFVKLPWA